MKRIFIFTLFVILAAGVLYPHQLKVRLPKITITNPNQNTVWCTGRTYTLTWQVIGPMDKQVNITLIPWPPRPGLTAPRGYGVAKAVPNRGSYPCQVPKILRAGKYYIRIATVNGKVSDNSPAFTVKDCLVALKPGIVPIIPQIEILKPVSASFWDAGKTYNIKWKANFKREVKILLYTYNKKFVKTITTTHQVPGTQQYSWTIPSSTEAGKYRIRIATLDNKVEDYSQKFTIRIKTTTRYYTVKPVYTKNRYKVFRKGPYAPSTPCQTTDKGHGDPGSPQMRVGHHRYSDQHGRCYLYFRSYAYFNLEPFRGKGLLLEAQMRPTMTNYDGNGYDGAYPNILEEKWNGATDTLWTVKTHRETSSSTGSGTTSIFPFTNSARSWIAYPNDNHGVVFTVWSEESGGSGEESVRYYNVVLRLKILEKE